MIMVNDGLVSNHMIYSVFLLSTVSKMPHAIY